MGYRSLVTGQKFGADAWSANSNTYQLSQVLKILGLYCSLSNYVNGLKSVTISELRLDPSHEIPSLNFLTVKTLM